MKLYLFILLSVVGLPFYWLMTKVQFDYDKFRFFISSRSKSVRLDFLKVGIEFSAVMAIALGIGFGWHALELTYISYFYMFSIVQMFQPDRFMFRA